MCYLKRKQTVIHLPIPPENVTTLTCELRNFFISLKVCCVLSNVAGSEKSHLWIVVGGSEKNRLRCVVWVRYCCNLKYFCFKLFWQLFCAYING